MNDLVKQLNETAEKLRTRNTELETNYNLIKESLVRKNAIINRQNEEIKTLKKEIDKLRIYQMKLGED